MRLRARSWRGALTVSALSVAVVLAGCTDDRTPLDGPAGPGPSPDATSLAPLARSSWQPGQSAMAASIPGVLVLGEDLCVRLEEQGGDDTATSVLWPNGWLADVDGDEVVIRDPTGAVRYRTGEDVELPGGFLQADRYDAQPCADGPAWQVVG